jgi:tetratricopeptide (TPR) repeat protein
MKRTDHSMLPPVPAATIAYKSPNACTICHAGKDARWADKKVRQWRTRDYQAPYLRRAGLVEAARKGEWSKLPDMGAYLKSKDRDEIFAASLIRLLRSCPRQDKWPMILSAMDDPSPLVRSAAAETLSENPSEKAYRALVKATGDEYRLVRVRAVAALAGSTQPELKKADQQNVDKALREYVDSLSIRADHWSSYYNMGNYFLKTGYPKQALESYKTAVKRDPRTPVPLVNMSMAYARLSDRENAEKSLRAALKLDPRNAAAHVNLGLLLAEQKKTKEAEEHFRLALKYDPRMAEAAYNLGILLSKEHPPESLKMLRKAYGISPNPKYGYVLAFFENQTGNRTAAAGILRKVIETKPAAADPYLLLGTIYESEGKRKEAAHVYKEASGNENLAARDRDAFERRSRLIKE